MVQKRTNSRKKSTSRSRPRRNSKNKIGGGDNNINNKSNGNSWTNYTKGLVKVHGQSIVFDWRMPFQIKNVGASTGSGFFISKDGHILTSAHVVAQSADVEVEISSESKNRYEAKVLGVCFHEDYDLALLQIVGYKPKYFFKLGDSDKVGTGDRVKAAGYPLGSNQLKVTEGIVSGREDGSIQTDTALNPGNSGGPLLLEETDEVIGINFLLLSNANAIGYAVPINHFYVIKDELMKGGNNRVIIRRPFFGFEFQNTNADLIEMKGSKCGKGGVLITRVYPGSPMERAGVRKGHILCSINGYQIDQNGQIESSANELAPVSSVIHTIKKGSKVPIEFWGRDETDKDKSKSKSLSGGPRKSSMRKSEMIADDYQLAIHQKFPSYEKIDHETFGGIVVMDLALNHIRNAKLIKYINPKNQFKPRLVITQVLPGSDIFKQEVMQDGDIILKVNDHEVNTVDQYRKAMVDPIKGSGGGYYIKIETANNRVVILNLKSLLAQEPKLMEMFHYNPSNTYKHFSKSK